MSVALSDKNRNRWTVEELNVLRNLYATAPAVTIIENLSLHSWGSIRAKACELHITKQWTDKEVQILINSYPLLAKRQIQTLLSRHPWVGIYKKARFLDLQRSSSRVTLERRIHRSCGKLTSEVISKIYELYSKGLSKRCIAEQLKIGANTVDFCVRPGAREKVNEKRRQRRQRDITQRKHRTVSTLVTHIDGKRVLFRGLRKREKPNVCELCERPFHLSYHHWTNNPNIGMWICTPCHQVATRIEAGFLDYYNKLKALIETEASKWQEQFIARLM